VYVDPRHKLPLTLLSIIQSSKETFKWNIRQTQVKCSSIRRLQSENQLANKAFKEIYLTIINLRLRLINNISVGYPDCGKAYHNNETTAKSKEQTDAELPTTTAAAFQESDAENVIIESGRVTSSEKSYRLSSRHSIDNAFYISKFILSSN